MFYQSYTFAFYQNLPDIKLSVLPNVLPAVLPNLKSMKYPTWRVVFDRKKSATKGKEALVQIEVLFERKKKYVFIDKPILTGIGGAGLLASQASQAITDYYSSKSKWVNFITTNNN